MNMNRHRFACSASEFAAVTALLVTSQLAVFNRTAEAQTVTVLHVFSGPDGELPRYGALVQGRDGSLFGTTQAGGSANDGVIYKMQMGDNSVATLHDFTGTDGSILNGGLVLARDGNMNAGVALGGAFGYGTLFKVSPTGTVTALHDFTGGADGAYPVAAPIQGSDGSIYGITNGSNPIYPTVYKRTSDGVFSTIYTLATFGDPLTPLLQTTDGSLVFVTPAGGTQGCGSILKVTTKGALKSTYSFGCISPNPGLPIGSLLQASDGLLYGTTQGGGATKMGTVFKLDIQSGKLTVLYNFGSIANDGAGPQAGLAQGTDGNFYGTTTTGGSNNLGTIFKITSDGKYTQLYSFPGKSGVQPAFPEATLVQHTNGAFYGTTENGGAQQLGSVFKLDVGLGPFITFVGATGKPGQSAEILGQNLSGATSVTFNGVPAASFKVVKDTYMTAVVPPGATTGPVVVETPTGSLTSNVSFRVSK